MDELKDLTFDPNTGDFCVAPSMSFKEMEDLILDDNIGDSNEIEDISDSAIKNEAEVQ